MPYLERKLDFSREYSPYFAPYKHVADPHIDAEIDTIWALIATLQTIFTEHDGDPHIKGALRLANSHLDALAAIQRDVDRL